MPERKSATGGAGVSKRGPDQGEAYGMAAVTQVFKGTPFPARRDDLIKKAGSERISWTKGGEKLEVAQLLREAPGDQFGGMREVISAISTSAKKASSKSK